MSLVLFGARILAMIGIVAVMIAVLPSGADYPFPVNIETSLHQVAGWMWNFDAILPIDTMFDVMEWGFLIWFVTNVLWKIIIWMFGVARKSTGVSS